jgi:hypothetical protein
MGEPDVHENTRSHWFARINHDVNGIGLDPRQCSNKAASLWSSPLKADILSTQPMSASIRRDRTVQVADPGLERPCLLSAALASFCDFQNVTNCSVKHYEQQASND